VSDVEDPISGPTVSGNDASGAYHRK
jgi:hypothetical protein